MHSSPTARDAAEGLADQIESRMKAASLLGGAQLREAMMDLGRLVYVESTPIITALRSAGTDGRETRVELRAALEDLVAAFDVNEATGTVTVKPDRILSAALRNARGALEDRP